MKRKSVDRAYAGSIPAVAHDRMPHLFHMHTNLVFAACVKVDFQHGTSLAFHKGGITCHCQLPFALHIGRIHLVAGVLCQIAAYGIGLTVRDAFDHSQILTLEYHIVPVVLQRLFGLYVFRKHHQPRRIAVKAVHDKNLVGRIAPLDIVAQYGVCRTLLDVVGAYRQQSVTFINHKDIVILIHQAQPGIAEHMESAGEIDMHPIARLKKHVPLCSRSIAHLDLAVLQQGFDGSARTRRHRRHQERQEHGILSHIKSLDNIRLESIALCARLMI